MKATSSKVLAIGGARLAVVLLIVVGISSRDHASKAAAASSRAAVRGSVSAGGFTLASASINLPVADVQFPDGPHADMVNANCTPCHSASMALSQPPLSSDGWTATVKKMREIYHAPVADEDVPAIVAYLAAMPGQKAAAAKGKPQDADPKVGPDVSGSRR